MSAWRLGLYLQSALTAPGLAPGHFEEYLEMKQRRPAQAAAVREAITLVVTDHGKAERDYSIVFGR